MTQLCLKRNKRKKRIYVGENQSRNCVMGGQERSCCRGITDDMFKLGFGMKTRHFFSGVSSFEDEKTSALHFSLSRQLVMDCSNCLVRVKDSLSLCDMLTQESKVTFSVVLCLKLQTD